MAPASARNKPSALVIAGGRGARFWPASRNISPKPLFSVDGKVSLLAGTIARLSPTIARSRTFVLVAAAHQAAFRRALRGLIPANNLIVEPDARGTAVAIAYGCAVIRRGHGDGVVAVMPADHLIEPAAGFRRTLADAVALARRRDSIVVIGITPTRAETGYGYQKIGAPIGRGFIVERFVEKPPLRLARQMLRSGKYLWNAGMFVMSQATLAREFAAHCPALGAAADNLATAGRDRLARDYRRLKFDSFDREIVEKSTRVLGVRAQFSWHDVGSWDGLWDALGRDSKGNVTRGNVVALESDGVLAHSETRLHSGGRLMVLFGVRDLVVVDTGDAILVTNREMSQHVRRVTEELARRKLHKFL